MKGYFISVEGTDGSGKSTQIALVTNYCESLGYEVVVTREPGGTQIGESIRDILLAPENTVLCDTTEILLYAASRAQHLQEKIIPMVQQGKIVLCDRFTDSSIAYQGFGRGLDLQMVESANQIATGGIMPDLTFYLDLPPCTGIERKRQEQGHILDRMERENMSFHHRVYEGYQWLCRKYSRIKRIDAAQTPDMVFEQIKIEINKLLQK